MEKGNYFVGEEASKLTADSNQNSFEWNDVQSTSQDVIIESQGAIITSVDAIIVPEELNNKTTNSSVALNSITVNQIPTSSTIKTSENALIEASEPTNETNMESSDVNDLRVVPQDTVLSDTNKIEITLTIKYPQESNNNDFTKTFSIEKDQSVLECLITYGKENKIPVVYSGSKATGYVEGINGCFEFDGGPESGWVYSVNGSKPSKSSGSYKLVAGDKIIWKYIYKLEEAF